MSKQIRINSKLANKIKSRAAKSNISRQNFINNIINNIINDKTKLKNIIAECSPEYIIVYDKNIKTKIITVSNDTHRKINEITVKNNPKLSMRNFTEIIIKHYIKIERAL
jgi:metal-responsive CopG/Arc/MetJ family transcriptional regulator